MCSCFIHQCCLLKCQVAGEPPTTPPEAGPCRMCLEVFMYTFIYETVAAIVSTPVFVYYLFRMLHIKKNYFKNKRNLKWIVELLIKLNIFQYKDYMPRISSPALLVFVWFGFSLCLMNVLKSCCFSFSPIIHFTAPGLLCWVLFETCSEDINHNTRLNASDVLKNLSLQSLCIWFLPSVL